MKCCKYYSLFYLEEPNLESLFILKVLPFALGKCQREIYLQLQIFRKVFGYSAISQF